MKIHGNPSDGRSLPICVRLKVFDNRSDKAKIANITAIAYRYLTVRFESIDARVIRIFYVFHIRTILLKSYDRVIS